MTRNRILAVITLLGAAAATVIITSTARSYSSAPAPARSAVTVTGYDRAGPGSSCSGSKCQSDFPRGPSLRIPTGASSYTAIITVLMQYATSARGKFTFAASLWKANRPHHHVLPRGRRLEPTASPESTTLVYRVSHLAPGGLYTVRYGPDISTFGTGHRHITTHHILVVVTARPTQRS
jgi:hypothetical protein